MGQHAYPLDEIDRVLDDALRLPEDAPPSEGPTLLVPAPALRSLVIASAVREPAPSADVFSAETRRSPAIVAGADDARTQRLVLAIWALAAVLFMWLAWCVYDGISKESAPVHPATAITPL